MKKFRYKNRLAIGLVMLIHLIALPVVKAANIEPEADKILKSMSIYLAELAALSMKADIDLELITRNGQKLQLSSSAAMVMKRPDKFHLKRQGGVAEVEIIFDGETLALHLENLNVYTLIAVPGTIDDAIRAYELETGVPAPAADLLFTDPYAVLSTGVESGAYIGTAYVDGVECHHLAFREADVDWQLWVRAGDEPLPMKYVITSKWHTGAPQYEIRLRDWNVNPSISDDQFVFSAPQDARQLETIPLNEWGEFLPPGEGQ